MANNYTANPIVLDSTMSSSAKNTVGTPWNKSTGVGSNYLFKIKAIKWDNAGTASKTVVLQDGNSVNVYSDATGTTAAPAAPIEFPTPLLLQDFQLTAIGSGLLYIYLLP